jgi:hypothetical protein
VKRRLASCLLPIGIFLFSTPFYAQTSVSLKGELDLPTTVYTGDGITGDGIQLDRGKFEVEIRSEKEHKFLAFLRNGEIVSLVNGQGMNAEVKANRFPDLPLIGTVYLHPPKPAQVQEKEEKSTVTFAEHLRSRPWNAALRAYRHVDPQIREVDFVLEEESRPGEWSRTDFKLFLAKPN